MRLRLVLPLTLCALAFPLAACGESEKDKYVDDFKPLNDDLLAIGRQLAAAVEGAESKSDAALATQFNGIAKDLGDLNDDIEALDTPDDLKGEADALNARIDDTVGDIEDIASAAEDNDAQAAAAATVKLAASARRVNTAQNRLAKATGAAVGES